MVVVEVVILIVIAVPRAMVVAKVVAKVVGIVVVVAVVAAGVVPTVTVLGRKYLERTMRLRRDGKWVRQHIPKEEKQYSIIPVHLFSGRDKQ